MAVEERQLEVEEDHPQPADRAAVAVAAGAAQVLERLGSVANHEHPAADVVAEEGVEDQLLVVGVVLDEEHLGALVRGDGHGRSPGGPTVKRNVAPSPGQPSAHTVPPWRSTMRATMARPAPIPGRSACWGRRSNRAKSRCA